MRQHEGVKPERAQPLRDFNTLVSDNELGVAAAGEYQRGATVGLFGRVAEHARLADIDDVAIVDRHVRILEQQR